MTGTCRDRKYKQGGTQPFHPRRSRRTTYVFKSLSAEGRNGEIVKEMCVFMRGGCWCGRRMGGVCPRVVQCVVGCHECSVGQV